MLHFIITCCFLNALRKPRSDARDLSIFVIRAHSSYIFNRYVPHVFSFHFHVGALAERAYFLTFHLAREAQQQGRNDVNVMPELPVEKLQGFKVYI